MQASPTVSSALRTDKKSHLQRLLKKPIRFLFDQAIGLGHTGARILEFQHGLDQARLHYPSDRHRVFEDMPRIGAVAPAFAPNFLYEGEKRLPVFRVYVVFNYDKDRPLVVLHGKHETRFEQMTGGS